MTLATICLGHSAHDLIDMLTASAPRSFATFAAGYFLAHVISYFLCFADCFRGLLNYCQAGCLRGRVNATSIGEIPGEPEAFHLCDRLA